ncbi:MAG: L-threonylcarbamoyladenylate synthase [Janthinobacterium lividum]
MFIDCFYPSKSEIAEPTSINIDKAVTYLSQGNIVALPTETVYGLAADGTNDLAIAKIYEFKNRPIFNPLILHFADAESIKKHVHWHDIADQLAKKFWPGPLTLVLNKKLDSNLSLLATAGLDTIGVRIPQHKTTLEVIKSFGRPLAAPSANPSESISPTSAQDVQQGFGINRPLFILDGGRCSQGLESTILDLTDLETPTILRPGLITREDLSDCLNRQVLDFKNILNKGSLKSPGQMQRHYAPQLPLRLNAQHVFPEEALLAFGSALLEGAQKTLNLSESQDLKEAAAHLFSMMRQLDQSNFRGIAVMPIPSRGIGLAINDRLQKAATSKI